MRGLSNDEEADAETALAADEAALAADEAALAAELAAAEEAFAQRTAAAKASAVKAKETRRAEQKEAAEVAAAAAAAEQAAVAEQAAAEAARSAGGGRRAGRAAQAAAAPPVVAPAPAPAVGAAPRMQMAKAAAGLGRLGRMGAAAMSGAARPGAVVPALSSLVQTARTIAVPGSPSRGAVGGGAGAASTPPLAPAIRAPGGLRTPGAAVDEKDRALKVCKFHAEAEGVVKEMLFVPAGMTVTPKKIAAIVKDQWKIPPPNMIVNLDVGTCHPSKLATKLLRDQPQFLNWIEQARHQQLKRSESFRAMATGHDDDDGDDDDEGVGPHFQEDSRDPACNVINNMIYQKLLEAFSAIVESACMSNNWILFDRTRLEGASGTAELLLELAMERTKLRPVVIVVDSVDRLKNWHHEAAAAQIEMLRKCREDALPISDENSHNVLTEHYNGSSYNTTDFSDWKKHPVYGTYTNKLSDLPSKPKEYHKEYSPDGTATISRERVWRYFYRMFMYNKGSHYVLLGDLHSRFPVDTLAPVGSVCAHGGAGMYPRLRDLIHRGQPTVMLYNSGGVTHSFASVHNAIMNPPPDHDPTQQAMLAKAKSHKVNRHGSALHASHHADDGAANKENITSEAERILKLVEVVSNEPWVSRIAPRPSHPPRHPAP
jgi:hypothetical protein